LVEALCRLIRGGHGNLRGLIVGRGETYERCRAIARREGCEDRIIHPGAVPHEEMPGLYSVAHIFAYPRVLRRITDLVTPLKPLEAMAMEKAVVGSDVGGLRELIIPQVTGLLHRPGDVGDLARKLET